MKVHKGWAFPWGIYSEVHSPINTPEIICVMALTLQPIRGCPQHSGEAGTWLSSAIHRRLLSQFSWRRGGVCTQAKPPPFMQEPQDRNVHVWLLAMNHDQATASPQCTKKILQPHKIKKEDPNACVTASITIMMGSRSLGSKSSAWVNFKKCMLAIPL